MSLVKRIISLTKPVRNGDLSRISFAYNFMLKFSVLDPKIFLDSKKSKFKMFEVFFAVFLLLTISMAIVFVSFRFSILKDQITPSIVVSLIEPTMPFVLLFILRCTFLFRARKAYSILEHVQLCDSKFEVTNGSRGFLVVTAIVVVFTAIASLESYSYLKSFSYGPVMNISYQTKMEYFEKITNKVCNLSGTSRTFTFIVGGVILAVYIFCQLTNLCCELTLAFFGLFVRRGLIKIDQNLSKFVKKPEVTKMVFEEALVALEDQFQHYRVAVDKMNEALGILTVGLFTRAISLVASMFFVIQFFGGYEVAGKAVGSWFISYLFRFLVTTMIMAEIPHKVQKIIWRLHELSLNPNLTQILKLRTQTFSNQDVSLNGLGFFNVNRSFVAAFLGGTISYLIIIVQFRS